MVNAAAGGRRRGGRRRRWDRRLVRRRRWVCPCMLYLVYQKKKTATAKETATSAVSLRGFEG